MYFGEVRPLLFASSSSQIAIFLIAFFDQQRLKLIFAIFLILLYLFYVYVIFLDIIKSVHFVVSLKLIFWDLLGFLPCILWYKQ